MQLTFSMGLGVNIFYQEWKHTVTLSSMLSLEVMLMCHYEKRAFGKMPDNHRDTPNCWPKHAVVSEGANQ